jgi:site-specific recombinase XerC
LVDIGENNCNESVISPHEVAHSYRTHLRDEDYTR